MSNFQHDDAHNDANDGDPNDYDNPNNDNDPNDDDNDDPNFDYKASDQLFAIKLEY